MSYKATAWAWEQRIKPATCKLVLMCLADNHNGDTGRCDPSIPYIAAKTGLDRKTVMTCLERLEQLGLLTPIKRPGKNTRYDLIISGQLEALDTAPPARRTRTKNGTCRSSKTASRARPDLSTTTTKNGTSTENGTSTVYGSQPVPKTGHEPVNITGTTSPVSDDTGDAASEAAAPSVDCTLADLAMLYDSPAPRIVFDTGVALLGRAGVTDPNARAFLGRMIADYKLGAVVDAVTIALLEQPVDPRAYIRAILERAGSEIPVDWHPDRVTVSGLVAEGVPADIVELAVAPFVGWFRERGIRHADWPALFRRWCARDWERAELDRSTYQARLARSAGLVTPFFEPA